MSLVETIFAFFIMTLVILAVINLFPSSLMANRRSELSLQANALADRVLEEARAGGFSQLTAGVRPPVTVQVDSVAYTQVFQVGQVPGQDFNSLRSLKVRITWSVAGHPQELVREVWVCNVRS
ncbi:type II secretion system protein [bacterium]|nr:type II secretion system protein [bacterium]